MDRERLEDLLVGLVVSLLHFAEWIFFFRVCVRCLESGLAWRQGTKILDVGDRKSVV